MMMMMMTTTLRNGDLDLNDAAAPGCSDSVKEFLRKAMLQHEIIFNSQVRELHRLYWAQRALMREPCYNNATAAEERLVLAPPSHPRSPPTVVWGPGRGVGGDNGHRPKMFDLRLPADLYIGDAGETPIHERRREAEKRYPVDDRGGRAREVIDLEPSVELEHGEKLDGISSPGSKAPMAGGRGTHDSGLFDLHSSGRTGGDYGCKPAVDHSHVPRGGEGRQEHKSSHSAAGLDGHSNAPSIDLAAPKQQSTSCKPLQIDLNATLSDDSPYALHDPASLFSSPSTSSSIVHHGGSDKSRTATPHPVAMIWREPNNGHPKENSFNSASKCSRDRSIHWLLVSERSKKAAENSWTHNWPEADNIVHGCEFVGTEELYRNPVAGLISGSNTGDNTSVNGELPSLTGLYKLGDIAKDASLNQEHCHVDSDSRRQASVLTSSSNDIKGDNMHASVLSTNLPTPVKHLEGKQVNCEGSEDDTLSSHTVARDEEQKDELLEESPMEEKSSNLTENNECNSQDKSVERHTEDSGTTQIDSSMTQNSPNNEIQKMGNCDRNCLDGNACIDGRTNLQDYIKKQQVQVSELDCMIKIAAETLVCLSLEHLECPSGKLGSSESIELDAKEISDEPQYSSDSYESITLMLSESRIEELSTLSRPIMKETGKETCGIRLRRGRGLRDFQKEILPGLVSLSRHEICEDLHYIGYELRKNRSRNRGNWLVPVRSRRSRRCSTRRRR